MDQPRLSTSASDPLNHIIFANMSEAQAKYIQDLEDRRRRRNSDILAKIQELQLTAAVHAARTDRFQQLRTEYEALARKYNYGGRKPAPYESNFSEVYATPSWNAGTVPLTAYPPIQSQGQRTLVSTGCNTIITGPVKPATETTNNIQLSKQISTSEISSSLDNPPPPLNLEFKNNSNMAIPIANSGKSYLVFADLSTTTESEASFTESAMNRQTVSQALAAINAMLTNETPDNSTTSIPSKFKHGIVNFTDPEESMSAQHSFHDRKPTFQKAKAAPALENQPPKPRAQPMSESPTSSIGDSLMDSIRNKTPDQLPRDESELRNINESPKMDVVSTTQDKRGSATDEENDESESELSKSEEDEVSDLSNPPPKKISAEEKPMTSGKPDGVLAVNNEVPPTVKETNVVFKHSEIGNLDEFQSSSTDEGEEEKGKDIGTEKKEKVVEIPEPSPVKVVTKPQPQPSRRLKVRLGASDSESSDLSEIGTTKPLTSTAMPSKISMYTSAVEIETTKPPMADHDDFFDFED